MYARWERLAWFTLGPFIYNGNIGRETFIRCGVPNLPLSAFTLCSPFLPITQEFDVENLEEALLWSGYMGSVAGFARPCRLHMGAGRPVWTQEHGRALMVGGGLTVFFMAYADSVTELLVARMLQELWLNRNGLHYDGVDDYTKQHLGYANGYMRAFLLGAVVSSPVGLLLRPTDTKLFSWCQEDGCGSRPVSCPTAGARRI